ncbi:hypothetical protein PR202_ga02790 [Eleusine coracana subsp. coracana]|uniref:Uncharacterized protein n=1 Tax=Eleusine coracana subsp. coracana TaxID=191504 RepID=A0AAV5BMH2_ELECO|nr:hypothetical protein PR202_ga02790 [Eleusine coracana subsp. coracana]
MTPTGSPKRRSSFEQVSGCLSTNSKAVGTGHASGGSQAAAEDLTAARRKGRSRAVPHGRRGAMGLPKSGTSPSPIWLWQMATTTKMNWTLHPA